MTHGEVFFPPLSSNHRVPESSAHHSNHHRRRHRRHHRHRRRRHRRRRRHLGLIFRSAADFWKHRLRASNSFKQSSLAGISRRETHSPYNEASRPQSRGQEEKLKGKVIRPWNISWRTNYNYESDKALKHIKKNKLQQGKWSGLETQQDEQITTITTIE